LPVYEYRCKSGHEYEKTEGFSAPARQKCPNCGARSQRMISLPAVIFKGSGFYHTDHGRGSTRNGGSTNTSDSSDSSASTAATSSSDDHSHGPGSHSHDTASKTEAAAAD